MSFILESRVSFIGCSSSYSIILTQIISKGIRGAGEAADKETRRSTARAMHIFQLQYFVYRFLISCVDNVFGLHSMSICFPFNSKLVT